MRKIEAMIVLLLLLPLLLYSTPISDIRDRCTKEYSMYGSFFVQSCIDDETHSYNSLVNIANTKHYDHIILRCMHQIKDENYKQIEECVRGGMSRR